LVLPAPAVFTGRILTRHGQPVPAVLVDVLTVQPAAPLRGQPAARKPGATGALLDSHVLASTLADAAGRFTVLLAPPPPAAAP
jgi:hypothetical protein